MFLLLLNASKMNLCVGKRLFLEKNLSWGTLRVQMESRIFLQIWTNLLGQNVGPLLWSSGQGSWLQKRDVLCFLRATDWIYVCYVEERRPPLWSSGQSSWLQIQRRGFDSRRYQIFWEIVGLEWGPPRLVSTIEELLGRLRSRKLRIRP
jgi:hypothetical protein